MSAAQSISPSEPAVKTSAYARHKRQFERRRHLPLNMWCRRYEHLLCRGTRGSKNVHLRTRCECPCHHAESLGKEDRG